jgi:hypothetical protein
MAPDVPYPDVPYPDVPYPDVPYPDVPYPDVPYCPSCPTARVVLVIVIARRCGRDQALGQHEPNQLGA